MTKKSILQHIFIGLMFVCLMAVTAFAQTTAFNFQGRLSDAEIQNLFVGTDGNVDPTFGNGLAGVGGAFATNTVHTAVLQPDGKIIIAGTFTLVNGVAQNNVARLNSDGTLDTTFANGLILTGATFIINVRSVALQTDGKIIIGGDFQSVNGSLRSGIARLNADGTLDTTFNPASTTFLVPDVYAVAVQTDGKIVIGSNVSQVRPPIERLNANGTPDIPFVTNVSGLGVYAIALQTDGKIVIGGTFNFVNTVTRNSIARLNTDGTLDTTFGNGQAGINNSVRSVALQTDGKVVIGGLFQTANGVARFGIARLNSDGTLDTSFGNGQAGTTGTVYAVKVQTDGKIVTGGGFININGVARNSIARLNADGTLDTSFGNGLTGADNNVFAVAIQPDKKIVIGGQFKFINGTARGGIARLQGETSLSINNVALNEGDSGTTAFNFTVSISAASSQTVTVNYATADGTANAPTDYQAVSGTLSFAPGEITKTITVLVNGDTTVEPNETFTVNLSGAVNATILGGVGTGTIINDDACTYSISPTGLTLDENGGAGNTIAVTTQAGCAYTAVSNNSFITITSGASGSGNGTVTFTVAANSGVARTGTITVAGQTFTVNQAASPTFRRTMFDFDGDGKADVAVYRPSNGTFYALNSSTGFKATPWGFGTDKIVPADYDGDGKTDVAVYRPSNGTFYILNSSTGFRAVPWGFSADIPIPADYDGDGKADIAVYRPSNGTFYALNSSTGFKATPWGFSTDKPIPADYDGDGKTDVAVYRPSNGTFYALNSSTGFKATPWGFSTDIPIPADYDGDGKTDVAVYRPSNGTFYALNSSTGFKATPWGFGTDIPIPADYDGDGKTDVAVYRPSNGTFYALNSSTGFKATPWGFGTDIPIESAYVP